MRELLLLLERRQAGRDAGFIEARGLAPNSIRVLSSKGREFLSLVRNPQVWIQTQEIIEKTGGLPSDLVLETARKFGATHVS